MSTFSLRKPPVLASICAFIGLSILLSLGTWQARKYSAKTRNLHSASCQEAPIYIDNFSTLSEDNINNCAPVSTFSGTLLNNIQIPVGPRTHEGDVGYHIYIPLQGKDYGAMLVNMGWHKSNRIDLSTADETGQENITITGYLSRPSEPNSFTPDNDPAQNQWFTIRHEQVLAAYPQLAQPGLSESVLYAQGISPDNAINSFIPAELSRTYLSPQMHLQYAAFWFSMAAALAFIFIIRFMLARKGD